MKTKVTILLLVTCLLAACDPEMPTITPTYSFSAPTLESSPTVQPQMPTDMPSDMYVGQNDPTAASMPSGGDLPPLPVATANPGEIRQTVQITLQDGTLRTADLYEAGTNRVPGVLMLAPDRTAWLDLPLRMQAEGFTVLTTDVNETSSLADFETMLRALSDLGTVDPASIYVVGAETGADLALLGCAEAMLCDAAALFSPTQQDALITAMSFYNPRPLFLAAAEDDSALAIVDAIRASARGGVQYETLPTGGKGALLIQARPDLGDALIQWLMAQTGT